MKRGSKLLIALGLLLILGSLGALLGTSIYAGYARREAAATVEQLRELLPAGTAGMLDRYSNMDMPVLQVGGRDIVAILEIPGYGLTLPVRDDWGGGRVRTIPARFCGTAYNGSLIIGGSDQPGQFDFFDQIQPGAAVKLTDMTGRVFSYTVSRIDRASSAAAEKLTGGEGELTLFVRDAYGLDYILLRCKIG